LVAKPEEQELLLRPGRKWADNIKLVELDDVQWIVAKDRDNWQSVKNTLMELTVQKNYENILTSWKNVSFSRSALLQGDA
jgi:hypothetical protein